MTENSGRKITRADTPRGSLPGQGANDEKGNGGKDYESRSGGLNLSPGWEWFGFERPEVPVVRILFVLPAWRSGPFPP
jgi:hypothetical protein